MEPLVRKQLYLTRRQDRWLKERARLEKRSEADIVRDVLDQALDARTSDVEDAIESIEALARRISAAYPAEPRTPGEGRGWTRDELYEERESRWLK